MAAKFYDYSALSVGATFTTSDTTKASAIGATTTALTNGVLTVSADAPTGLVNSVEGTSQSVSGTTYITETITSTGVLSVSVYWKMPTSVGTLGAPLVFLENAGNRQLAMTLLSTEQMRFLSASGATLFDTTFSGGFVAGQWYRTDFHMTQGTSTTGRLVTATYAEHGLAALTGTTYDSGTTVDVGTLGVVKIRHGTRAATGTADENIRLRMGYDRTAAYLIGPQAGDATVTGVAASASAAAVAPTVSGVRAATVGAFAATAVAAAQVPAVSAETVISSSGAATATGMAIAPAVSATRAPTAAATAATASASAVPPAVTASRSPTVVGVAATATGAAVAPAVSATRSATVAVVAATASAGAGVPVVATASASTVIAVAATVSVTTIAPVVSGSAGTSAVKAGAAAQAYAPTVSGSVVVVTSVAVATARAWAPAVFIAASGRDIVLTVGLPVGHQLHAGLPTGHPFAAALPRS